MSSVEIHTQPAAGFTADRGRKPSVSSDRWYQSALWAIVAFIGAIVLYFVYLLISDSIPGWRSAGFAFFTTSHWLFGTTAVSAWPLILGTLVSTVLALLLAVPVGIGAALAIVFLIPRRLQLLVSSLIELLAVVPSIVYGVWGSLVLAHWLSSSGQPWLQSTFHGAWPFNGQYVGYGIMLGAVVLAVMIMPIITAISRDVIVAVPRELIEGAYSLGATRGQVIRKVILPNCKSGITGAIVLATGRALGETIALATVLGGVTNFSPFPDRLFATGSTLAAEIAIDFGQFTGSQGSILFCLAVMLLLIVGSITYAGRSIIRRSQRQFS